MITTEVINLTPELAAHFLKSNLANRPVSKATLERYEKAISRGEWALNGEPMILFSDGTLGDGQHRCRAVTKTGISIKTVLVRGVDRSTFNTLNGGKLRNAADVLSISGEINSVKLSTAARTYLASSLKGRDAYCITSIQIQECIAQHPDIRYWANKYSAFTKMRFLPASFCGYMAMSSEKHGINRLEPFFDQLCTGANLSTSSPALVLRERFMEQTKVSKLTRINSEAFIIKAINAYILGRKLTFLRYAEGEAFPAII